jgi:hypothetical protein
VRRRPHHFQPCDATLEVHYRSGPWES